MRLVFSKLKLASIFIVFLCSVHYGKAQVSYSTTSRQAIKLYEQSDNFLNVKNYTGAIDVLQKAVKEDKSFIEAYQRLGDIYRINKNNSKAKENYLQVVTLYPDHLKQDYFYLGEIELKEGNYEQAKKHLDKFMMYAEKPQQFIGKTKKYLADCKFGIEAKKNPVPFNPQNLGPAINTNADEYLPSLTADGKMMIFTRKEANNEDFYTSELINNEWSNAVKLKGNINTSYLNEGAQSLSSDGQYLLLTICNAPGGHGRCDIYYSKLNGNEWSSPVNIGSPINTGAWESQPCLAPDGRTLYFASDRKGGQGKIDIWKSYLEDDESWSEPENLGPTINTPEDEQSPFIHPDNETLYFSSNGWPGMGNSDIYFSQKDTNGSWKPAVNAGYPINTHMDDFCLVVTGDGSKGYFSTNNTEGKAGHDLYVFDIPQSLRPNILTFINGVVYDEKTGYKLDAVVEVQNLKTGKTVYRSVSNSLTGQFYASLPHGNEYAMNVSKEGYLFYSGYFSTTNIKNGGVVNLKAPLKEIAVGEKIVLKNIFFETNSFKLSSESMIELQKVVNFMRQNPELAIEISGHTDNVGDDKSNQQLSENRAKVVYGYLLRAIPNPKRFTYKGFGENQPIDSNDTVQGRANNRRTELKIVSIQ
ncbi:OmpA family protein [Solitalea lacus]|uniref:OmpA family protein n=1 Tax=Solitalea lacus TaxID=2911172 RepID=UPI001EDC7832|nr:OmpA family protein [Solitalea lacus]UKJ05952.1 OmpA family protein [Solitalea lacus]